MPGPEKSELARATVRRVLAEAEPNVLRMIIDGEPLECRCLLAEIMNAPATGPKLWLAAAAKARAGSRCSSRTSRRRPGRRTCSGCSTASSRNSRVWQNASHKAEPGEPAGLRHGTNALGNDGYDGPLGTVGRAVRFRLCALDRTLDLPPGADQAAVDDALAGHVLAQTELAAVHRRKE